ncbi:MAG TPA: hypothetical protein VLK36_08870 [Gaiellaceae bacterium]|nr:hypothetical protein [Gaiellaceae bacterium]
MPIQNIKRVVPMPEAPPGVDVQGGSYAVHYDDGSEPLIVVVYVDEGYPDAGEDHVRATAGRHVDEHGLPEQRIVIVVDRQGNTTAVHHG